MNSHQWNEWNVGYHAIQFFEKALSQNRRVVKFRRENDIFFVIERDDGEVLRVLLVDEYKIGLSALIRAKEEFPLLEYIVTSGNWNAYTKDAKDYGYENDIGVFVVGEFFGALYSKFPKKYVKKDDEGNKIFHFR